jgi:hypothetical protein
MHILDFSHPRASLEAIPQAQDENFSIQRGQLLIVGQILNLS